MLSPAVPYALVEIPESSATAPVVTPQTPAPAPAAHVLAFPPPPPPRIPTNDPSTMSVDSLANYSLLDDIRQQQSQHASAPKEKVSLYGFPSYLILNVRRVLARNRSHRADWGMALSCLVWQGLARYAALPSVAILTSNLSDLDTDDELEATAAEQIELWRRTFKFQLQDPTYSMGVERVRSWKAPEYVSTELHDLAGRIGVSTSTLGTVSVMVALEGQDGVLGAHAGHMREVVAELDARLEERGRRLRSLVGAIEAGVWR
jgi:hypothetical protein